MDKVAIERFVNQRCYFYLQELRNTINLSDISSDDAKLEIDENGNLTFSIGVREVFKVSNEGIVEVSNLFLNGVDLRNKLEEVADEIIEINEKLNAIEEKLGLVTRDGTMMNIDGDLKINGTLISTTITANEDDNINVPELSGTIAIVNESGKLINTDGFFDSNNKLTIPSLTKDEIIATTSNIPTDYAKVNESGKLINTDGFSDGSRTLSIPTLSANRTIATTNEIPSVSDFVTMSTNQTVDSVKNFTKVQKFPSGVSLNGSYTITLPNRSGEIAIRSDVPLLEGGNSFSGANVFTDLTLQNASYMMNVRTSGVATSYPCYFPTGGGTLVSTTGSQTLTNKTISKPSFSNVTKTSTWYNSSYLNSGGIRYDFGDLHIFTCNATFKNNLGGSLTYYHILTTGGPIPSNTPILCGSETWYGEKGLYARWKNRTNGDIELINNVGWTAGQQFNLITIWID